MITDSIMLQAVSIAADVCGLDPFGIIDNGLTFDDVLKQAIELLQTETGREYLSDYMELLQEA